MQQAAVLLPAAQFLCKQARCAVGCVWLHCSLLWEPARAQLLQREADKRVSAAAGITALSLLLTPFLLQLSSRLLQDGIPPGVIGTIANWVSPPATQALLISLPAVLAHSMQSVLADCWHQEKA